jgi:hypothetical protein
MPTYKSPVQAFIQKRPSLAIAIAVGFIVMVSLLGWLLLRQATTELSKAEVVMVEFSDGQNSVVVRRDGTVTINTPYGTFTQKWSKEKVEAFFARINDLDFDALTEFVGGDLAVQLTFQDGSQSIILIEELSEEIVGTLEDALEETYTTEVTLPVSSPVSDPFADDESDDDSATEEEESGSGGETSSTEEENPWFGGEDSADPEVFGCEEIDATTGRKVVISNTVCLD